MKRVEISRIAEKYPAIKLLRFGKSPVLMKLQCLLEKHHGQIASKLGVAWRTTPVSAGFEQIADFGEQFHFLGWCRWRGLLRRLQAIDPFNAEKQNPSDDQKVEQQGEKVAPCQNRTLFSRVDQSRCRNFRR